MLHTFYVLTRFTVETGQQDIAVLLGVVKIKNLKNPVSPGNRVSRFSRMI